MRKKRQRQLECLCSYEGRLKKIVSALLASADAIDQESQYLLCVQDRQWSRKLAEACTDLVLLGDNLAVIESYARLGKVGLTRNELLKSLDAAEKLLGELREIRERATTLGQSNLDAL